MSYFPTVDRWMIPQDAMEASFQEMALDGRFGCEGIALWLGRREGQQATVTHVVALRGRGVIKRPALLSISPEIINQLTDAAIDLNVALVGQVHSHGPLHGTNLSPTDRDQGVRVPYYLSVVAPDYAQTPATVRDCGVHVFHPQKGYIRLSPWEAERQVVILPELPVGKIVIGAEQ